MLFKCLSTSLVIDIGYYFSILNCHGNLLRAGWRVPVASKCFPAVKYSRFYYFDLEIQFPKYYFAFRLRSGYSFKIPRLSLLLIHRNISRKDASIRVMQNSIYLATAFESTRVEGNKNVTRNDAGEKLFILLATRELLASHDFLVRRFFYACGHIWYYLWGSIIIVTKFMFAEEDEARKC